MVIVMNKDKIKKILDKTDIYVLDEINILEYIDELEKVKEDYIKSLDKLDVLENRNNKANNELEKLQKRLMEILKIGIPIKDITDIQNILRGKK